MAQDSTPRDISKKEKQKNTNSKKYIHLMFIATLFIIDKIWKQPKFPSMDKANVVHTHTHTHNGILQPFKKDNEILPFAAMWMNLEDIMINQISQTKTNTYIWTLKNITKRS